MARPDVSALRDQASQLVEKGKFDKAIEIYGQLEAAEPHAAAWPKKIGEVQRRAGNNPAAVAALERAVDKFVAAGFLVQAIAVCKLILQIDGAHGSTLRRVGELTAATHPAASPSDMMAPEPPKPATKPPPPPPAPVRQAARHSVPAIIVSKAPRHEANAIEMASLVPTSRKLTKPDGSDSGISLIEIDLPEIEIIHHVPDESLAARLEPGARLALRRTPLFADLPPRVLEGLVNRMELLSYEAGDTIVREGEPGTRLFVISEGEVSVETRSVELTRLGPSAFFGEISMVTDLPRSATIRAIGHVEVLAIDREVIRAAASERPDLVTVLLKFVRERLIDRVARTSELFLPFAEDERASLAKRFELVEVVPEVALINQGERADGLYIMLAGQVAVLRGEELVAGLGTGDVFGEISLMSGGGSTATVRTTTRVLALRLPAKIFQEVIMTHPQVLAYLGELSDRRTPRDGEDEPFVDLHVDLL